MKKILVSDYDDTFFTNVSEIYENIEKIKEFQNKGNLFVITTSRSWKSIKEEINKYHIPYDYVCCNTGAGIFDKHETQIYANFITPEEKQKVEEILEKEIIIPKVDLKITRYGIPDEQEKKSNQIVGYKIKGDKYKLEQLKNNLSDIFPNFQLYFKKEQGKLFLNNKANTKEKAIEELFKFLPKDNYHVITVGDDDVDYNMIKKYDGYRMDKSSELLTNSIHKTVYSITELL